jgi:hypothetical protein
VTARKLKDLPGWAEASVGAAERVRRDGSKYQDSIGDRLRIIGAFVAPPSVDRVSVDLVKALVIGLARQAWQERAKTELARQQAEKVVYLKEAKSRLAMRAIDKRFAGGDWSGTWTDHMRDPNGGGVPGL